MNRTNARLAIAYLEIVLAEDEVGLWAQDIRDIEKVINLLRGKM